MQCFSSRYVLDIVLGALCLLAVCGVLHQPTVTSLRLTDAQTMAILTTHCPALRQQPDVLGCLPAPAGIRLITDRPALMPTQVAGFPVLTEPPSPHLPPPPGVIVLRPDGPDPQPTLSDCPPGYTEHQKYRWRFCNSPTTPQPIPTSLMIPPIAGMPYTRAEAIFHRQDFIQLPGVQSVGLGADGIIVQTTEPTLIPSTFEGLPVRTEKPLGVLRPTNHTKDPTTTVRQALLSSLKGGVAIGDHLGGGTLGGFVWSGGVPWLVTASHNFESKCGIAPPCQLARVWDGPARQLPAVQLYECDPTPANGIPAKIAPASSNPLTVSTLTRWTQLTGNAVVKAEAATGFVDVKGMEKNGNVVGDYPINRRLEKFSRMVTGYPAESMPNEKITVIGAIDSVDSYWGRPYRSSHPLGGEVDDKVTVNLGRFGSVCGGATVEYQDMINLDIDDEVLPGTSGALVVNGNGNILGMVNVFEPSCLQNADRTDCLRYEDGTIVDQKLTQVAYATKAVNIKAALKFDHWVGSETVPLQGGFEIEKDDATTPPVTKVVGWAVDPLNPRAALTIQIYETRATTLTANARAEEVNARGHIGNHGFAWPVSGGLTQSIYRQVPMAPSAPSGGTSTDPHIPTGWSTIQPAPTDTVNVYRSQRTVTYQAGVFQSATAWGTPIQVTESTAPPVPVYALDQTTDTTANPAVVRKLPELKLPTEWAVSGQGQNFLKNYEGLKLYPYCDDAPNVRTKEWSKECKVTIGWGHHIDSEKEWETEWQDLHDETNDTTEITEARAETIFQKDLEEHVELVKEHIKVPVSQTEFDALSVMVFNLGGPNFVAESSMLRFLDGKKEPTPNYDSIEAAWKAWIKTTVCYEEADGETGEKVEKCPKVTVPGLIPRRRDEWTIFLRGHYERTYD